MSTRAKLKKAILDEVFPLDIVMWALYSKFGVVHQAVVHLHGWHQQCARRVWILNNIHVTLDNMQAWMMKYKGALVHLPKMTRANAVELQAHIRSQIWNYEDLPQLLTSIHASHAWVFKIRDVVVHIHAIPSLWTLTQVKAKKHIQQKIDSYFDDIIHTTTNPDLPIRADIMCKYVAGWLHWRQWCTYF